MPGIVVDEIVEDGVVHTNEANGNSTPDKQNPKPPLDEDGAVIDTSIERLYENVCDMQSSDRSPSRLSLGSDGEESRIDSELRHLVGGEMKEIEIMEEEITAAADPKETEAPEISKPVSPSPKKPPRRSAEKRGKDSADGPDVGRFLLRQARQLVSSGDHLNKALDLSLRAAKSFEACSEGDPSLDHVMCLHVTAAVYCGLGRYNEAVPVLQRSIEAAAARGEGEDRHHRALARFAGKMQLGDTYAVLGMVESSLECYASGLEIQREALGEADPRFGETCRYLAEAYFQALRLDEARGLCQAALDIHRGGGAGPATPEEAADRRLMGLICETAGDHEAALEHLVLAGIIAGGGGGGATTTQDADVAAAVDRGIGDAYLSLTRYDEAASAYQKALTELKAAKGEGHPSVGAVYVRLAELYGKTGRLRESKSCCESALRIFEKPAPGTPAEEVAAGLSDVAAVYEAADELDQALRLLEKALKIYRDGAPGKQGAAAEAGVEAQIGVVRYMMGDYAEAYGSLKSAVGRMREGGDKKGAFFGVALNQMGLACVQRFAINEAVDLFEEAREVLEKEYGPYHPDTLGVYSNLAGTYDAVGRLEDAIELLEYVVGMREEKLGTANPEVDDERRRLAELLKEAGRARNRKARSLGTLLDSNSNATTVKENGIKV